MFLIPAHYFKPSSSSLSRFLVSPGHVSHVLPDLTFAFFSSPMGISPAMPQWRILLSGTPCEPHHRGHCPWCSLMSRTQMAMPRPLSSNISKAMLVPTVPVSAHLCCGTWKSGYLWSLHCLEGPSAQAQLSPGVRPSDPDLTVLFA